MRMSSSPQTPSPPLLRSLQFTESRRQFSFNLGSDNVFNHFHLARLGLGLGSQSLVFEGAPRAQIDFYFLRLRPVLGFCWGRCAAGAPATHCLLICSPLPPLAAWILTSLNGSAGVVVIVDGSRGTGSERTENLGGVFQSHRASGGARKHRGAFVQCLLFWLRFSHSLEIFMS